MTKKFLALIITIPVICFLTLSSYGAETKTAVTKTIDLSGVPVDTAASADGKYLFVLTNKGEVNIYTADGKLKDSVKIDSSADIISASPDGSTIYLTDREKHTTQVVSIDFVYDFDLSNSPIKGKKDAPVAVAIFSDFQ